MYVRRNAGCIAVCIVLVLVLIFSSSGDSPASPRAQQLGDSAEALSDVGAVLGQRGNASQGSFASGVSAGSASSSSASPFPELTEQQAADLAVQRCSRERQGGAAPMGGRGSAHTCGVEAPATPGCAVCKDRLQDPWSRTDPFGVAEFHYNVREKSRNFVPIFADLDKRVRQLPGRRVVIDVGYTTVGDAEWVSEVYSTGEMPPAGEGVSPLHRPTRMFMFEPNPVTFRGVKEALQQTRVGSRMQLSLFNVGIGPSDGQQMFWFNKDGSRSSFQRVRSDDYEQVPILQNVTRLDSLFPTPPSEMVVPLLKVSAGRWEESVLRSGEERLLKHVAVVLADVSAIPNNSRIVDTLSRNGFHVYALGCGTLARIHPNRPWWWSPIVAVKPFLVPVAESYTCWDFSTSSLVCDSPIAALRAPEGCHVANISSDTGNVLLPDVEPVFTTTMASPDLHWRLKVVFVSFILMTLVVLAHSVLYPLLLAAASAMQRTTAWDPASSGRNRDGRATPPSVI